MNHSVCKLDQQDDGQAEDRVSKSHGSRPFDGQLRNQRIKTVYLIMMMGANFEAGRITSETNVHCWHNPDLRTSEGSHLALGKSSTSSSAISSVTPKRLTRRALIGDSEPICFSASLARREISFISSDAFTTLSN